MASAIRLSGPWAVLDLAKVSYWLDWRLAPASPLGAANHNTIDLLCVAFLIAAVVRRLSSRRAAGFFAACAWLLLPSTIAVHECTAHRSLMEGLGFMLIGALGALRPRPNALLMSLGGVGAMLSNWAFALLAPAAIGLAALYQEADGWHELGGFLLLAGLSILPTPHALFLPTTVLLILAARAVARLEPFRPKLALAFGAILVLGIGARELASAWSAYKLPYQTLGRFYLAHPSQLIFSEVPTRSFLPGLHEIYSIEGGDVVYAQDPGATPLAALLRHVTIWRLNGEESLRADPALYRALVKRAVAQGSARNVIHYRDLGNRPKHGDQSRGRH